MDQIKIGKFIAECRKKKNLTQATFFHIENFADHICQFTVFVNLHIVEAIQRRNLFKVREADIATFITHANKAVFAKESRLALSNRMISFIIQHKNSDRQSILRHCLQFLNIHLETAFSGAANNRFSFISHTSTHGCG